MNKSPRESVIVNRILKKLKTDYPLGFWIKIHGGPYQQRGIPDIIGSLYPSGRFIGIEVKRPGPDYKEPTLYQKKTLSDIRKSGGVSFIASSYPEVRAILEKITG